MKPSDIPPRWHLSHIYFADEYKRLNPPIEPFFDYDTFLTPCPDATADGFLYDKNCVKIYLLKKIKKIKMYTISKEKWRYFILDHDK